METRKPYIVLPENAASDCNHQGFETFDEAKEYAIDVAERENAPYSVYKCVGVAEPKPRPVIWSE